MDYFLDDYYKLDCENKINYLAILLGVVSIDIDETDITDSNSLEKYDNGKVALVKTTSFLSPYFTSETDKQTYRASYSIPITTEVTKILISDTKTA
jgi:hypothetical protein